jgi:hypothetical protein
MRYIIGKVAGKVAGRKTQANLVFNKKTAIHHYSRIKECVFLCFK